MRRISGLLILLCALFVCPALANAGWRCVQGSVYSYTYANGSVDPYYYVRYLSNGCWYYRRLSTISPNSSSYTAYGTTGTENWRSRLLDIAANRDRYESASKASALEHNEFLESVKALGLEGNFRWMGYGYAPTYATGAGGYGGSLLGYGTSAAYGGAYGGAYGNGYQTLTGNTAWGVSQTPFATATLSTANLDSALNQAGRLVTQAQQLAGQGFNGYSTLVTNVGSAQLDALKTIAQGYAAASALQASRPSDTTVPQTSTFSFGAQATGTPTATTAVVSQGTTVASPATATATATASATPGNAVETVLLASCINCHGPTRLESNLDARNYQNWTAETWGKVVERITTTDPKRRMPAGGEPLSVEATQTLINTAAAAAATAPAAEAAQ